MKKIIFFGTSDFAVPALKALLNDERFEVVGVVTQADKPVGRHAILTPPAIKKFLASAVPARTGIPIKQPLKLKDEDFKSWITDIGPSCDAFVIVSYGKILPQWLLDLPKKGIVNVHGSLLPRWRGASPIQAAIAAGDALSGVTVMLIDAEMDHGPLLATADEKILAEDTGSTLHDRLALLGGHILPDILSDYLEGKIQPQEQDHEKATYCKILSRDDGKLDFTKTADELERLIRAYDPWPGTWMEIDGKRVKILSAKISQKADETKPADRFVRNSSPCITCADGTVLEIVRLQPEGKKAMEGSDYLRGKKSW
ncbi:MAG: methionyl-tRNA formyltransferase [Patescibacteria group bacterium]|nr:methionyl-tRNA formyltransferase [Patescibacteria group bacterium]